MALDSALVWFRRDLRDDDHAALHQACRLARRVVCVFVFDTDILDALPRDDRRVGFIHEAVGELRAALLARGGGLVIEHGRAREVIPRLAAELGVDAVLCNRDYEPASRARDAAVAETLRARGIDFLDFRDQVAFERDELLASTGQPYTVFTPYRNAWLKRLDAGRLAPLSVDASRLEPRDTPPPTLRELGFTPAACALPTGMRGARALLDDFLPRLADYARARDFPARAGPSYLSAHLRFGTISIRALVSLAWRDAGEGARVWLSELIWREFYQQLLWHFPRVAEHSFKAAFDAIAWPNPPGHFEAWREARTGYPLVDAAMRQIAQTGYMHNRLRMVTASFLVKDLLVDWRQGERYFAAQLLDFELASNNGGWQWAASTGCDAQPWFRIFNPVTQSVKFDPGGRFIRRYLPELARVPDTHIHAPWKMIASEQQATGCVIGRDYPAPVVDHATQRGRALALFAAARDAVRPTACDSR